jgi:ATP-dependent protease ClpP protease subunit
MIGTIHITGEIGTDTTLLDVIKQVKAQSAAESFLVKIDSLGGYVDSGMDIYHYLKNLSIPVTTYTTQAYSIASVIFMAGDTRIIPENAEQALMIHLPWMTIEGNTTIVNEYLAELKSVEDSLVKFYSDEIGIDKNTILSLLKNTTYLSSQESLDLGFATQLQVAQKAVAKLKNNNKEEKEEENFMNKISRKLDNIFNMLSGKIKAELRLQDATGVELVFADLDSSEVPEMDSKATVDNKPAEGEFLMADGSTMVFEKGLLTELKPAEVEDVIEELGAEEAPLDLEVTEDVPTDETPADATPEEKDAMIADLQDQVMELKAKLAEYEVEEVVEEVVDVEEVNKMVELIEAMAAKQIEMETKYQALAKSVGSDFNSDNKKEIKTSVKGSVENLSRAAQILNSK